MQIAADGLKGRVFECNLADLQNVRLLASGELCFGATSVSPITMLATGVLRSDAVAALVQNETDSYRKIRLRAEDVQGRNVLTNFWVPPPPILPQLQ